MRWFAVEDNGSKAELRLKDGAAKGCTTWHVERRKTLE